MIGIFTPWKWQLLSIVWLCDLRDSTVHGILQARIPEWVAFPFSGDLPNPAIEPRSPALQADSLPAELQAKLFSLSLHHKHWQMLRVKTFWGKLVNRHLPLYHCLRTAIWCPGLNRTRKKNSSLSVTWIFGRVSYPLETQPIGKMDPILEFSHNFIQSLCNWKHHSTCIHHLLFCSTKG